MTAGAFGSLNPLKLLSGVSCSPLAILRSASRNVITPLLGFVRPPCNATITTVLSLKLEVGNSSYNPSAKYQECRIYEILCND